MNLFQQYIQRLMGGAGPGEEAHNLPTTDNFAGVHINPQAADSLGASLAAGPQGMVDAVRRAAGSVRVNPAANAAIRQGFSEGLNPNNYANYALRHAPADMIRMSPQLEAARQAAQLKYQRSRGVDLTAPSAPPAPSHSPSNSLANSAIDHSTIESNTPDTVNTTHSTPAQFYPAGPGRERGSVVPASPNRINMPLPNLDVGTPEAAASELTPEEWLARLEELNGADRQAVRRLYHTPEPNYPRTGLSNNHR